MSARAIRRSRARKARQGSRRRRIGLAAGSVVGAAGLIAPGAAGATNFPVSNTNDSGAGSLRVALGSANGSAGPDTVSFNPGVTGEITLLSPLAITDDVTINGPGAGVLSISGDSNSNNAPDFATSAV